MTKKQKSSRKRMAGRLRNHQASTWSKQFNKQFINHHERGLKGLEPKSWE